MKLVEHVISDLWKALTLTFFMLGLIAVWQNFSPISNDLQIICSGSRVSSIFSVMWCTPGINAGTCFVYVFIIVIMTDDSLL